MPPWTANSFLTGLSAYQDAKTKKKKKKAFKRVKASCLFIFGKKLTEKLLFIYLIGLNIGYQIPL
tara:strand:+ start:12680 stop:12874 length:195 start_codon:yes stop_codon:yes gene_type:complete